MAHVNTTGYAHSLRALNINNNSINNNSKGMDYNNTLKRV
jgi:hypothetical protein